MDQAPLSISVVIPVYNAANSLEPLSLRLINVLTEIASQYEIIFVNDGSHDNSWQIICDLSQRYATIRGINLMRNYGQHNATLCGVRSAQHEIIVTMDDDLQHPPEEIPHLLKKLAEGYDVVYGSPKKLPHSLWRNLSSRVTKITLAFVMGITTIRDISAFRAFRTELRKAFVNFQSPGVILDVLLAWGTTRFASVAVDEHPRQIGHSNYTFMKLLKQVFLILTGFSTAPLRFASLLGFALTLFGLGIFAYVVILYLTAGSIPGFPFLASIISIFSGTQLFTLGIFGEYLAHVFDRSMDRPSYVIGETTPPSHK
ncbi:MAG: glycosyltransferase family 2 protein [Anaerolineae bacterium]|nr:glycosyltransferase family 2 protein [Anaerolineae bacterium]